MKINSILLLALLCSLCFSGCAIIRNWCSRPPALPPQPWVGNPTPTREEIIQTVNRNSQNIRNFSTENASIQIPDLPFPLNARITFERPQRLRILGSATSLGSREFDFGSNDELFWFWMKRSRDMTMWFCRHELYPISPMRELIPFEPGLLIEAIGIVEFKPTDQHFGPTRLDNGNWEIISHLQKPSGLFIRRMVFDHKIGWIVRQELYTPQYELVAVVQVTNSRYDGAAGIYYAKRVEVQSRVMPGTMIIDLGNPTFNRSEPFASSMFEMPEYQGYRVLDLSSPEFLHHHSVMMPPQMPHNMSNVPEASMQTVIR